MLRREPWSKAKVPSSKAVLAAPRWSRPTVSRYLNSSMQGLIRLIKTFTGSFIIFNKFGRDIHPREAKLQLSPYGPLSKCEPVHPQILEALKLQNGIMIEFENFDPGRDVVSVSDSSIIVVPGPWCGRSR